MKMNKIIALILVLILAISVFSGCSGSDGVVVASKQFTESIVLGEILAQLIEAKTDIPVTRKMNLGDTAVLIPAMQNEDVDIYFEYSGTAYGTILGRELVPGMTADEVMTAARAEMNEKFGITMFDAVGNNNTYALAMKTEKMNELGISKISDLSALSSELKFGGNHVFYTRIQDGYEGVTKTYNLNFKDSLKMDKTLLYEAIDKGELDVIVVFGTDSLLKKYEMTVLEDDKNVFPPYQGSPMCLNSTLEKYPELNEVLNMLVGLITDEIAQDLNYQVDVEQRPVEEVAKEFLEKNGLI